MQIFITFLLKNFIFMNKILQNIETIRKEKGIKQSEIADKLGIAQPSYSRYFTESGDMKLSMLQHIADILEVSLVDIIIYPDKYEKKGE